MDRRATTLLWWLMALLVVLGLAGPSHVAVLAADLYEDASPIKITLVGPERNATDEQPEMVLVVESTLAAADARPAPFVSPEPVGVFEPPTYPRMMLPSPPCSPTITAQADPPRQYTAIPSQQLQPQSSDPDPEQSPPLSVGVSARETPETSIRPEPGRRPTTTEIVEVEPYAAEPEPRSETDSFTEVAADGPQPLPDQTASLLLPPSDSALRSDQLERIAQQADHQTRRGFELAGRGAYFAARSQFIKALRLLAQGLDTEHQTDVHSHCLSAGLTAIDESTDFIPSGSRLEADLDLREIIESHRTPVFQDTDFTGITPMLALQCYFTFAQEQLAAAAGGEVAGSMALHALGKLHAAMALHEAGSVEAAESKAVAFYQAALLTYPQNLMASNDLGVLLARCGYAQDAEAALKYSLSINPQPTTWHNLAVVYQQLGNRSLADQAEQASRNMFQAETARRKSRQQPSQHLVQWIDTESFNQLNTKDPTVGPPAVATAKPAKPSQAPETEQSLLMGLLPWITPEKRR